MIRRVAIRNFKRFREETFELADAVVLAGPNNSGKSTLLQAISTWKLGLDRWAAQRAGGKAVTRSGVAIPRADFTSVPLREMNLLWEDRRVTGPSGMSGTRRLIEIVVDGEAGGEAWSCGLELQYANPELAYARPVGAKELDREDIREFPPAGGARPRRRPRAAAFGDRTRRAAARPGDAGPARRPGAAGRDTEEPPARDLHGPRREKMAGARRAHPRAFPDRVEQAVLHAGPALHPVRIPRIGPRPAARPLQRRERSAPGPAPARLPVRAAGDGDPARRARRASARHPATAGLRHAAQGRPRARRADRRRLPFRSRPRRNRAGAGSRVYRRIAPRARRPDRARPAARGAQARHHHRYPARERDRRRALRRERVRRKDSRRVGAASRPSGAALLRAALRPPARRQGPSRGQEAFLRHAGGRPEDARPLPPRRRRPRRTGRGGGRGRAGGAALAPL